MAKTTDKVREFNLFYTRNVWALSMKHIKATEIYHFQSRSQKVRWYLIKFHQAILAT